MRRAARFARIFIALALLALASVADAAAPKYIFLLIGDGMGPAQVNVTEAYLAGMRSARGDAPRDHQLNLNSFPYTGQAVTASLSGVTDSAAAATALSTGHSTINGAIAMNPNTGESFTTILADARARGMRTGVVTSAFLQDATPAAFYARAAKRTSNYEIGSQLPSGGVDFFGGAGFRNPNGKDKKQASLYDLARKGGYRVVSARDELEALRGATGRIMAVHPKLSAGSMPLALDETDDGLRLAAFTRMAIEALDGPEGFMLVVEGGRIDIACHANDAAACVREVIDFDAAAAEALSFLRAHPEETLIVATADHETGGMAARSLDPAAIYGALSPQAGSYAAFERTVSPNAKTTLDDQLARAEKFFGARIEPDDAIRRAFRHSMTPAKSRPAKDKDYKKAYGPYDPLTVAIIRQLNARAGITWTTFYHTGANVPVWAAGAGAERFSGTMKNTELNARLRQALARD